MTLEFIAFSSLQKKKQISYCVTYCECTNNVEFRSTSVTARNIGFLGNVFGKSFKTVAV